jgi:hypothetical protein
MMGVNVPGDVIHTVFPSRSSPTNRDRRILKSPPNSKFATIQLGESIED